MNWGYKGVSPETAYFGTVANDSGDTHPLFRTFLAQGEGVGWSRWEYGCLIGSDYGVTAVLSGVCVFFY